MESRPEGAVGRTIRIRSEGPEGLEGLGRIRASGEGIRLGYETPFLHFHPFEHSPLQRERRPDVPIPTCIFSLLPMPQQLGILTSQHLVVSFGETALISVCRRRSTLSIRCVVQYRNGVVNSNEELFELVFGCLADQIRYNLDLSSSLVSCLRMARRRPPLLAGRQCRRR